MQQAMERAAAGLTHEWSERVRQAIIQAQAENELPETERRELARQRAQRRVDGANAAPGKMRDGYTNSEGVTIPGDGINCKKCLNRGLIWSLVERDGGFYETATECKCMGARRSVLRLRASGLEKTIHELRFENFKADEPWQNTMLEMAQSYLKDGADSGHWMYIGGQPGCGKTHVCTAAAGQLLHRMPVLYAVWPQTAGRLKAIVNDDQDSYRREVDELQSIDVLYIDDLFKPVKDDAGRVKWPTGADVRLAFEILNMRYINRLPTIITSEWTIGELVDIDEATASRIAERCGSDYRLSVERETGKNWRLRGI